jgi:hypothetical protein
MACLTPWWAGLKFTVASFANVPMLVGASMDRPYTFKEKAKITAGAVAALIIVGWMVVIAIAILSAP